MTKNNVTHKRRYVFQKNYETTSAVNKLLNMVKTKIEENNIVVMILIDMKKAFSTISKSKLIEELHNLGIQGTEKYLMQKYLSKKIQTTTPTILEATNYMQNTESHRAEIYHQSYILRTQVTCLL